jgi:hypothetical protein
MMSQLLLNQLLETTQDPAISNRILQTAFNAQDRSLQDAQLMAGADEALFAGMPLNAIRSGYDPVNGLDALTASLTVGPYGGPGQLRESQEVSERFQVPNPNQAMIDRMIASKGGIMSDVPEPGIMGESAQFWNALIGALGIPAPFDSDMTGLQQTEMDMDKIIEASKVEGKDVQAEASNQLLEDLRKILKSTDVSMDETGKIIAQGRRGQSKRIKDPRGAMADLDARISKAEGMTPQQAVSIRANAGRELLHPSYASVIDPDLVNMWINEGTEAYGKHSAVKAKGTGRSGRSQAEYLQQDVLGAKLREAGRILADEDRRPTEGEFFKRKKNEKTDVKELLKMLEGFDAMMPQMGVGVGNQLPVSPDIRAAIIQKWGTQ